MVSTRFDWVDKQATRGLAPRRYSCKSSLLKGVVSAYCGRGPKTPGHLRIVRPDSLS